jgi:putative tryptophan/tyrosine transport system substrate-binding protein
MRRREFICLLGGSAMYPLVARAQPTGDKLRFIGVLMAWAEGDVEGKAQLAAFREKLQELGWTEERNLRLDVRWTGSDIERMRVAAKELVGLQPDLIFTATTPAVMALTRETSAIPIIFVTVTDPLGSGLVTNLARPGGNITGFTNFEFSIGGRLLQTLKGIAPHVRHTGLLFNPATAPFAPLYMRSFGAASLSFRFGISTLPVGDTAELEGVIRSVAADQNPALIVMADVFTCVNRERIIALAAELGLPAIYPYRFFATEGGLISYGIDTLEQFSRAASYADRILRGAKPGDLPIQPTKFELVINLRTAKSLGLTVPRSLLASADEVIK